MRIDIVTILPEMFDAPVSALDRRPRRERDSSNVRVHDLRDWTPDRHRTTDDAPSVVAPAWS